MVDFKSCKLLPHVLDNQLTDGSKAVSLKHRPPAALYPEEFPCDSFPLTDESTPGPLCCRKA
jgi:hypothetical protein